MTSRQQLPGDITADVAIVGAGYTGLWTAYYLHQIDPTLRVVVVEAEFAGFGASGRNGGWLSALLPMSFEKMAKASRPRSGSRPAADDARLRRRGGASDERKKASTAISPRADISTLLATNPRSSGSTNCWTTTARGASAKRTIAGCRRPRRRHVSMPATCSAPDTRRTARRSTRRDWCEGWPKPSRRRARRSTRTHECSRSATARCAARPEPCRPTSSCAPPRGSRPVCPGYRRTVAPIYSLMIATEPLPDSFFDEVGWAQRETFNDDRRLIIYGQRTADDRIAFGGRGAPYHFGSAIKPEFDRHDGVQDSLRALLERSVPDHRRRQGHPPLGRPDRRAPRLVLLGRLRSDRRLRRGRADTSATA